ncbi:MAG: CHASE domain-containing protein, partial [Bacteroidota bacterium]|nr:CHASE domain-containing protein [Bacteroidota bacterium]
MKQKRSWVAVALLITGFIVTIYATYYVKSDLDRIAKNEFTYSCNEISSKINNQLHAHAQVLRSGAAFISSSDTVTREEWKTFIDDSKLSLNLPGIQGTGFSLIVPENKLQQHIRKIRSEGFPDYTVKPEGRRETYTSIVFLEPFSGSNLSAFGYDMFSEPMRREAMERARDKNVAALSGKVTFVHETGPDMLLGNIMFVPVYRKGAPTNTVEQRRHAISGWISCPYRLDDLMSGILEGWELQGNKKNYLHIFDGMECTPQSMLFESHAPEEQNVSVNVRFSIQVPVDFNGHRWTLVFTQRAGNMFIAYISAWTVFFGGILISLLLFFLARSLINTENKAKQKAERLTSELKESEKRFQTIFEASPVPLSLTRLSDGVVVLANNILGELFHISTSEIIGKKAHDFYANKDDRNEILKALANAGSLINHEIQLKKADGRLFWVHASYQTIVFGNEPLILTGFYDITKRKQAEEELHKVNRIYAVVSNINQAIVRVQDKQDKQTLFEKVCRIAVEDGKFRMVWIGMLDPRTNKVNPVASAGYTEDYLKTININLDDEILGNGPIGRSVKSGNHYLANDIANNPEMIPWSENALKLGYKSSAAFPLIVFGRTIGTLNLYANEPFFFDDAEVKLLDELAMDISFGIEFI